MAHICTILVPFLLKLLLVLTVAAQPLTHDELDQILDPEELLNMALPPSSDSAWFKWDNWDTWNVSQDIQKNFTYYRSGYDEDGLVVYATYFGKYQYRELVHNPSEKIEEFWKYHEQLIRRAEMDGARANYAAESFLMLAKPFVGDFIDKFEIYGTRSEKWRPRLTRKIPVSQLPPEMGGFPEWKPLPERVTES